MPKHAGPARLIAAGMLALSLAVGGAASAQSAPAAATISPQAKAIAGRPVTGHLPVVATAYGPSAQDNFPFGATDAFGQPLRPGMIAVDPAVIPLGSTVWVSGYRSPLLPSGGFLARAMDTGGAIKGNRIDIYIDTGPAQVGAFGIQHVQVTLLGK